MNKKIFVACDVSTIDEATNLIEKIKDDIFGIKVGLQYISATGTAGIQALSKFKLPIFYDYKAFDIKNTVCESIKSLKKIGVSYATIHLLNGENTLVEARKISEGLGIKLVGVSVLTNFSDSDLESLGFSENVEKQVQKLTKIASKANLPGIVCSPHEVKIIKKISPELLCFTPGIRFDSEKQDQKRTMNAKEALESGSDFLIIGRPITSGDPKKNIKNILNSIK